VGLAFEGARIRQGMRGASGAIERVHIGADVAVEVIGGGPAAGICGSGLIDALSELLAAGVLDRTGRLPGPDELPAGVPAAVRRRVTEFEGQRAFVLVEAEQSRQGQPILLTQRDIREAQLGKAAIAAGLILLQRELGVGLADIERVYLAGAFGNYLRPQSARRIGLLPDVPLEKILFVGNAAGTGAREALLSVPARRLAEQLAGEIEYMELAGRSDFQAVFSDCLFFPER
jgi:uncharacterized 2Fe-2S/4Fe-4S cluster protein (DUF4445 family)